jgi:ribosomal protein S18 acetylase RimI-like enzyme
VVQYRSFRNTDPPALAVVWNEALTGRGAVRLRHSSPLESYVFAKAYFDPVGLIVAEEGGQPIGFAHAGFGPTEDQRALDPSRGVTCVVAVNPAHQRRGIGSDLLRRCERYLADHGAQSYYAGPVALLNPFYFGLVGGSETHGFLASDSASEPFMSRNGYQPVANRLVFQRALTLPVNIVDGRFPALRNRYEVRIVPRSGADSWWQECVLGPIELVEFRLHDKMSGKVAAHTSVWEMDLFSWRWSQPAVGILNVFVQAELRCQGLAKFLLAQMLRYLQEQFFGIAEVQAREEDLAAIKLYRSLGFEQVDVGRQYKK